MERCISNAFMLIATEISLRPADFPRSIRGSLIHVDAAPLINSPLARRPELSDDVQINAHPFLTVNRRVSGLRTGSFPLPALFTVRRGKSCIRSLSKETALVTLTLINKWRKSSTDVQLWRTFHLRKLSTNSQLCSTHTPK